MTTPEEKVAAALRECESACPCAWETKCGCGIPNACCRCANPSGRAFHVLATQDEKHGGRVADCLWPGHAAIARLRDAAEKAGYERGCKDVKSFDENVVQEREAAARLAGRIEQAKKTVEYFASQPCPEWIGKTAWDWLTLNAEDEHDKLQSGRNDDLR